MTIKILYIHSMMFHRRCWQRAAKTLAGQGIIVIFTPQAKALTLLKKGSFQIVVAELSVGQVNFIEIMAACLEIPHRLGLSAEIESSFTTFDDEGQAIFRNYTKAISVKNYGGALLQLVDKAGFRVKTSPLKEVISTGIYHPEAPLPFDSVEAYLAWRHVSGKKGAPLVALLFYHGQLVEENLAEEELLKLDELLTQHQQAEVSHQQRSSRDAGQLPGRAP